MANRDVKITLIGQDKSAGKALDGVGQKAGKVGPLMAASLAAVAAGAVKVGTDSVAAFKDAEQASLRLDEALRKYPATNDRSRASFDELNSALARKTRFDDDATASGQAVLAQFGLTGQQLQQLTPLLQDYAARTGKELPDAALDLGKAVQGQGRALKAVGLDLKDTGSASGNLAALTAGLRAQVGGFAEAEGKTAAGSAAILGNRFGEVQEAIGARLVPALTFLANKLITVIDFVDRNSAVIVPLVGVLGGFAAAVWAVNAAAKAYTAVQAALNVVMAANPIGLVVLAIAALAAGLVVAYQKSETFRNVVNAAFSKVLGGVTGLLRGIEAMLRALGKIPGFGWATTAANAVAGARRQVEGLARAINGLPKAKTVTVNYQQVGNITPRQADRLAGRRAKGGIVDRNQPYLVGERGPEVVVPAAAGVVMPNSSLRGGSTLVVNMNGPVYGADSDELAENVRSALVRMQRNGRSLGFA